jgi:curli biogenesis system outer membrane secretion channel CsgG
MSTRVFLAIAALVLTAGPVCAQQTTPPTQAKPAKEKKLCRPGPSTGSIMTKTQCRTREQWDQQREANDRANERRREGK